MLRHAVAPHLVRAADALQIARTLPAGAPGVVLTFDDGPHPEGTPAILELLARARQRAMFFMVGEQVERRPALAREVAAQGHAIAVHCHRHRLQTRLRERVLEDDVRRAREAIAAATGLAPVYHRPPYGVYSPAGLRLARSAGLTPLLWSRWGKDWRRFTTPARIARRVVSGLTPGDVILLHDADFYSAKDSHRRTAKALELIVGELKAREIATVLPL
jgi:peptidoglycan/xylan/chitin deacetylase (PgdA/CDA1 family)